jgi:hypothetical protein
MARHRRHGRLANVAILRSAASGCAALTLFARDFAVLRQRAGAKEFVMRSAPLAGSPGAQEPHRFGSRRKLRVRAI